MIAKLHIALLAVGSLSMLVDSQLLQAVVYLQGPSPYVKGNLTLSQNDKGSVAIWGKIIGLSAGKHGFHIHEKGDITGGCLSTGGHFNPYKRNHGGPLDTERHVGDLGNINAGADGVCLVSITDSQISLSGPFSILGRAIVVHSDADDFGKGGHSDSLTTGHAGSRVACGVIGVLTPMDRWSYNSSPAVSPNMAFIGIISLLMSAMAYLRV